MLCGLHSQEEVRMPWDPAQYLKFADHRLRPAIDLLNRVVSGAPGRNLRPGGWCWQRHASDQGALAGGAASPEWTTRRPCWGQGRVPPPPRSSGSSVDLATGSRHGRPISSTRTRRSTGLTGHEAALPRACSRPSRPRGVLAVQMPRNFGAPSHSVDPRRPPAAGPGASTLEPLLRPAPVADPDLLL